MPHNVPLAPRDLLTGFEISELRYWVHLTRHYKLSISDAVPFRLFLSCPAVTTRVHPASVRQHKP